MNISLIDKVEEQREISLDWFYHSTSYNRFKYFSIFTEGIKCAELLHQTGLGTYNGKYYISLSKITIPDNMCFIHYTLDVPSFIINGIKPIYCIDNPEYEAYIMTKDPRRMGNLVDEYQYYRIIKSSYINGLVYNLQRYVVIGNNDYAKRKIEILLELIGLLDELNLNIPIYDYSRRGKTLVHEINKEKLKYYSKDFLL